MTEPRTWKIEELPHWARERGGETKWRKWIKTKVDACLKRAKAWAVGRGNLTLPSRSEWNEAIWQALLKSEGYGYFSHFPLSLLGKATDWNWPSVDHVESLGTVNVVIEVRLINDMKTIMTPQEFQDMIGHLSATLKVPTKEVPNDWQCSRSFKGIEKPAEEPPLPKG
jgi:hypothetical protein